MASSSSTFVLSTLFSSCPPQSLNPDKPKTPSLSSTRQTLKASTFLKSNQQPTFHPIPLNQIHLSRKFRTFITLRDGSDGDGDEQPVVGEDSAEFVLSKQKLSSWIYFTAILGTVLFILNVAWLDNSTGLGKPFVDAVSELSDSPEVVMLILILIFAIFHSGLASLRDTGEKLIGERAFRVLFAGTSLPLAVTTVLAGQVIWCVAHTIWIGNSVAVAASLGLIGHHLFGAWNGDRRLAIRYGEAFEVVKKRTSIIPFAAILDGRQKLPKDYYKEFIRLPYLSITALTLGAYFAHPLMQAASFRLHW